MGILNDSGNFKSGYYWSFLKEILPSEIFKDWLTWSLRIVPGRQTDEKAAVLPHNKDGDIIFSVAEKIIRRAELTFPSIFLEETIPKLISEKLVQKAETKTEIHFILRDKEVKERFIEQAKAFKNDSFFSYFPSDKVDINSFSHEYGSRSDGDDGNKEKDFLLLVNEKFGPKCVNLFQSQSLIPHLLTSSNKETFHGQHVDFCLQVKDLKMVVEIDGKQHDEEPQKSLDITRDSVLRNSGWKVFRIANTTIEKGELLEKEGPPYQLEEELRKLSKKISQEETNLRYLITAGLTIPRIQIAILKSLRRGLLPFNTESWVLGLCEREEHVALLAIADLLEILKNLSILYSCKFLLKKVEVFIYQPSIKAVSNEEKTRELAQKKFGELGIELKIQKMEKADLNKRKFDFFLDISAFLNQNYQDLTVKSIDCSEFAELRFSPAIFQEEPIEHAPTKYISFDNNKDEQEKVLVYFLQNLFRKKAFWEGQVEVIKRVLGNKKTISLMPTGAGKSLTYQLPGLLLSGCTLVVDPLISLMEDQIDNLKKQGGIERVGRIGSQIEDPEEKKDILDRFSGGDYYFFFISPERMQIKEFREKLSGLVLNTPVNLLVIDEAHCVSEWGHDFRPAYLDIGRTLRKYFWTNNHQPPFIALTGTASRWVLIDVQQELEIEEPKAIVEPKKGFKRENLYLKVILCSTSEKREVLQAVIEKIRREFGISQQNFFQPNGEKTNSGIVFVPHSGHKTDFSIIKVRDFLKNLNCKIGIYAGGKNPYKEKPSRQDNKEWQKEKMQNQRDFKENKFPIMVATKAFGMGIDKPNVCYTIHYQLPQSLEGFYQEFGRAGRDRESAFCFLIFSNDNPEYTEEILAKDHIESEDVKKKKWNERGDILRNLHFYTQEFKGIPVERTLTEKIFRKFIEKSQSRKIEIPFAASETSKEPEKDTERGIYRLLLLGLVEDYTKDWNKRIFEVSLPEKITYELAKQHLGKYFGRYLSEEDIDKKLVLEQGEDAISGYIRILVKFIYERIETHHRSALKNMIAFAKDKSNEALWNYLLNYLEESVKFDPRINKLLQEEKGGKRNFKGWFELIQMIKTPKEIGELIGRCSRFIDAGGFTDTTGSIRTLGPDEDYGLYITRGLAQILGGEEINIIKGDITAALAALRNAGKEQELLALEVLKFLQSSKARKSRSDDYITPLARLLIEKCNEHLKIAEKVYLMNHSDEISLYALSEICDSLLKNLKNIQKAYSFE